MFANPGKIGGLKKVMEWAHATDFDKLPQRAPAQKGKPHIKPPRRRSTKQGH
jgi:hypothetical protein